MPKSSRVGLIFLGISLVTCGLWCLAGVAMITSGARGETYWFGRRILTVSAAVVTMGLVFAAMAVIVMAAACEQAAVALGKGTRQVAVPSSFAGMCTVDAIERAQIEQFRKQQ